MADNTIYFNSLRGRKTQFGTKLSINVEKFIEELKANQNEKGYVNIELKERREADKYGNTTYAVLDTWKPNKNATTAPSAAPVAEDSLPF
jgi:hypothetical protein